MTLVELKMLTSKQEGTYTAQELEDMSDSSFLVG